MAEAPINKKTVYMARRTKDPIEDWQERWRRHASLAMTRPFWPLITKYSQCDVVREAPFDTGEDYDGVGLCWQTPGKASGINGMTSDPEGMRLMIEDEKDVFGVYVGDISVIAVERVLKEGHGAPFKMLLRVHGKSEDFVDKLYEFGRRILSRPELDTMIHRLSAGWVEQDEYTEHTCLDFDGLVEISVGSLDIARAILDSAELRAVAESFVPTLQIDWRILVTRENMFWDPADGVDERARLIREYPPLLA